MRNPKTPSHNFEATLLLLEIDLQCKIIARTAEKLRESAEQRIKLSKGIDVSEIASKIDIVAMCSVCLSAAASIYKLLFVGKRTGKKAVIIKRRCDALMLRLGSPSLPVISSLV